MITAVHAVMPVWLSKSAVIVHVKYQAISMALATGSQHPARNSFIFFNVFTVEYKRAVCSFFWVPMLWAYSMIRHAGCTLPDSLSDASRAHVQRSESNRGM
jgi:hypothetical protein